MHRSHCQLQPAGEIIPDSIEEKIADRVADRFDVFARAAVRVGREVTMDVNVADGGSVEHDGLHALITGEFQVGFRGCDAFVDNESPVG